MWKRSRTHWLTIINLHLARFRTVQLARSGPLWKSCIGQLCIQLPKLKLEKLDEWSDKMGALTRRQKATTEVVAAHAQPSTCEVSRSSLDMSARRKSLSRP